MYHACIVAVWERKDLKFFNNKEWWKNFHCNWEIVEAYIFSFVPQASQSRLLCQCEGAFPQGFVVSQSCGPKRLDSSMDMSNQLQISVLILFSPRGAEAWNSIYIITFSSGTGEWRKYAVVKSIFFNVNTKTLDLYQAGFYWSVHGKFLINTVH